MLMHDSKNIQYLSELSYSYWKAQALFVAVDMGLFTLLEGGGGMGCGKISKQFRTNPRATEMLLNALASLNLL